jgi:hypothetical protein
MPFSDEYTLPKSEDARLRRMAQRHGYTVRKSRWRLDSIDNLGGYMVVDPAANLVVAGARFDLTGADVAAWLTD